MSKMFSFTSIELISNEELDYTGKRIKLLLNFLALQKFHFCKKIFIEMCFSYSLLNEI